MPQSHRIHFFSLFLSVSLFQLFSGGFSNFIAVFMVLFTEYNDNCVSAHHHPSFWNLKYKKKCTLSPAHSRTSNKMWKKKIFRVKQRKGNGKAQRYIKYLFWFFRYRIFFFCAPFIGMVHGTFILATDSVVVVVL